MGQEVILPIILALLTTLVTIYGVRKQDRRTAEKQETDRAAALNDMALELIAPYKAEVAELRCEILKLKKEYEDKLAKKDETIAAMQEEIDDLRGQIEALQKGRRH